MINNKEVYLNKIKAELSKIANTDKPLEEIEKRVHALDLRSRQKLSSLDALYEVHKLIPQQISLISFSYEEDNQIVLRGQAQEFRQIVLDLRQRHFLHRILLILPAMKRRRLSRRWRESLSPFSTSSKHALGSAPLGLASW